MKMAFSDLVNKKVVDAYKDGHEGRLKKAFGDIKKVEAKILKTSGKKVSREWFMPDELVSTPAGA